MTNEEIGEALGIIANSNGAYTAEEKGEALGRIVKYIRLLQSKSK